MLGVLKILSFVCIVTLNNTLSSSNNNLINLSPTLYLDSTSTKFLQPPNQNSSLSHDFYVTSILYLCEDTFVYSNNTITFKAGSFFLLVTSNDPNFSQPRPNNAPNTNPPDLLLIYSPSDLSIPLAESEIQNNEVLINFEKLKLKSIQFLPTFDNTIDANPIFEKSKTLFENASIQLKIILFDFRKVNNLFTFDYFLTSVWLDNINNSNRLSVVTLPKVGISNWSYIKENINLYNKRILANEKEEKEEGGDENLILVLGESDGAGDARNDVGEKWDMRKIVLVTLVGAALCGGGIGGAVFWVGRHRRAGRSYAGKKKI